MPLHGDVRVEVVQRPIALCAIRPRAMIKALDLVVPPPGTLFDRVSGQRDERVGLGGGRARIGRAPNEGLCPLRRFLVGESRRGRCLRSGESARGGGIIGLRVEVRSRISMLSFSLSIPCSWFFFFFVYRVMDSILLFHASSRMVLVLVSAS